MIRFSASQVLAFRDSLARAFADEMKLHCKRKFPRITAPLSDDALGQVVMQRARRAKEYGFALRGPVRLFVELTFVFGAEFETDPQFPFAEQVRPQPSEAGEMVRARELFDGARAFLLDVHGPGGVRAVSALRRLEELVAGGLESGEAPSASGEERLLLVEQVFPGKAEATGEIALRALFAKADDECARLGFDRARDALLVTALMLAFGHGCFRDAAQPWIAASVADTRATSAARAERLQRRAVAWLRSVNAARDAGP